jgi:hypothetical protein
MFLLFSAFARLTITRVETASYFHKSSNVRKKSKVHKSEHKLTGDPAMKEVLKNISLIFVSQIIIYIGETSIQNQPPKIQFSSFEKPYLNTFEQF